MSLQGNVYSETDLRGGISVPSAIQTETVKIASLEGAVKEWKGYYPEEETD